MKEREEERREVKKSKGKWRKAKESEEERRKVKTSDGKWREVKNDRERSLFSKLRKWKAEAEQFNCVNNLIVNHSLSLPFSLPLSNVISNCPSLFHYIILLITNFHKPIQGLLKIHYDIKDTSLSKCSRRDRNTSF